MHFLTRIESEEQVDYSRVSGTMGGLGSFAEEFDAGYFTPHPSSVKTTHVRLDELGSDERTQHPVSVILEVPIPPEPSLSSPTLSACCSEDIFPVVIGMPSTSQVAVAMPSVIMAKIPSTASLPALVTLPNSREDSLKFSFEATSGVEEASGDGFPSESTPVGPIAPVITNSAGTSLRIPGSASSLLQLLALHIMNIVQGRASTLSISMEVTPPPAVPYLALLAPNLATDDPLEKFFNFSISDFMQLLRRCINMILSGHDFLELRRLMLNNYLDNIERIGSHK